MVEFRDFGVFGEEQITGRVSTLQQLHAHFQQINEAKFQEH